MLRLKDIGRKAYCEDSCSKGKRRHTQDSGANGEEHPGSILNKGRGPSCQDSCTKGEGHNAKILLLRERDTMPRLKDNGRQASCKDSCSKGRGHNTRTSFPRVWGGSDLAIPPCIWWCNHTLFIYPLLHQGEDIWNPPNWIFYKNH
jgi:hypothetical protein